MNLKVPIYFSAGLTRQANMYYKMLISWTSQKIKETYSTHAFDFKNVHKFERSMIDAAGPCVLFSTPGMISGGFSLEVFKHWAPSEKNLIAMPGYCVAGTIGHKFAYCIPVHTRNLLENQETESNVVCLRLQQTTICWQNSEMSSPGSSFCAPICSKKNCPYGLSDASAEETSEEAVFFCCSWATEDEKLPWKIISLCQTI